MRECNKPEHGSSCRRRQVGRRQFVTIRELSVSVINQHATLASVNSRHNTRCVARSLAHENSIKVWWW